MQTIESLRDILHELQEENVSLHRQAEHARLLFSGLQSLLSLGDDADPFTIAFASLRDVFSFEMAVALVEEGDGLECVASTDSALVGSHWDRSRLVCKVMAGRATATAGSGEQPLLSGPFQAIAGKRPAMVLPISLQAKRGVIVLVRDEGAEGFSRADVMLGQRYALLASQALSIRVRNLSEYENQRLQELARTLEHRAYHDDLTGIGNRAKIERCAGQALATAGEGMRTALIFIDIDRFKRINDYFGHLAGDALLRLIAQRLDTEVGEAGCVGRISGDEFVIIFAALADEAEAARLVEGVRRAICTPFRIEGNWLDVTASIGVCLSDGAGETYDTLRRNADFAMYRSKAARRGEAVFFSKEMGRDLYSSIQLERLLREAVEHQAFEAVFQPKVRIEDHAVIGFEALARWRERDGTLRSPGEFIPAATELGLLNAVTFAVVGNAIAALDRLDARFGEATTLAINIGGSQANDPAFMAELAARVTATGRAGRLILELTEDAMVQAPQFRALVQPMLVAAGIRVAIDDFGTGYSSLSVLAELEADELKIDRSFITRIEHNPVNQRILRAIEKLAHAIGLQTVAEGVETAEELAYLTRNSSVDIVQGYYFARPMPAEDLVDWGGPEEALAEICRTG